MKSTFVLFAIFGMGACLIRPAAAESFTYFGELTDSAYAAAGNYDFRLTLYADAKGTKPIAAPITLNSVPVHHGAFSVAADFGLPAKAMKGAYIGEQVEATGGKSGFSRPNAGAVAPFSSLVAANLDFDGGSVLTDLGTVIGAHTQCSVYVNGNCVQGQCIRDAVSNCDDFAWLCLINGGSYSGSSESGTCEYASNPA
jgi:hypothetical protein